MANVKRKVILLDSDSDNDDGLQIAPNRHAAKPLPAKADTNGNAEDVLQDAKRVLQPSALLAKAKKPKNDNSHFSPSLAPPRIGEDGFPTWFAHICTDGKEMRFAKRMMGEVRNLFSEKGRAEQERDGIIFVPGQFIDPDTPFKLDLWHVWLKTEGINEDSRLFKDLKHHNLDGVVLEIQVPGEFPLKPPFVRVKYPKLSGGYIFEHGAICFEPLTPKGWPVAMQMSALMISIKGILDYNPVGVSSPGNRQTLTVDGYTMEGAQRDYQAVVRAHDGGSKWIDLKNVRS